MPLLRVGLAFILVGSVLANDPIPERIWSHELTGESFYKHTISIGNHGSQVFCDTGYITQNTRLYSTTNEIGSPVWSNHYLESSLLRVVDSSKSNDTHAVWRQELLPDFSGNIAKTYIYNSQSLIPLASYAFSTTENSNGNGSCSVSEDGRWVTASTSELSKVRIVRFDLASSTPTIPTPELLLSHFGAITSYHSSADGFRLYLGGQTAGVIYDFSLGAIIFDNIYWFGAKPIGHSFSGDGKTILVPDDDRILIYQETITGFTELIEFAPFPPSNSAVPWTSALSYDGDIAIVGYAVKPEYLDYHIFAWRVSTGEELLHHIENGVGNYNNIPTKVCLSKSGDKLVVGSYGDEGDQSPELLVFQLNPQGSSFEKIADFNLLGSVYDMDLSLDGNYLVVSRLSAHQGAGTGSKVIEAYDLGVDFQVIGVPNQGGTIDFKFKPSIASGFGYLLTSDNLADNPTFSIGTLYLERQSMVLTPMGVPNLEGVIELFNYNVQGVPGTSKYCQGYALTPRELSKTLVYVTTLP
jgi:hypothetical protein